MGKADESDEPEAALDDEGEADKIGTAGKTGAATAHLAYLNRHARLTAHKKRFAIPCPLSSGMEQRGGVRSAKH
eukprot:15431867-Alexandrium_andersonii.AAC.1